MAALSCIDTVQCSRTFNRWWTVVSGTWKYDDPRLNMSHEGTARVWHVQPRVILFPCPTNDCVSYVLSSEQLNKLFLPLCLQNSIPVGYDLNTQARGLRGLCSFSALTLLVGRQEGHSACKKLSGRVLVWLSVWSEVQTYMRPCWYHCHSLSLAPVKSRLVLPFWYRLTWVVPEKGPLNVCVCVCVC